MNLVGSFLTLRLGNMIIYNYISCLGKKILVLLEYQLSPLVHISNTHVNFIVIDPTCVLKKKIRTLEVSEFNWLIRQ